MSHRPSTWLVAAVSLLIPTGAARAQRAPADPFGGVDRFDCTFTVSAAGRWIGGDPRVDTARAALRFQIEDIEPSAGTARARLGAESAPIVAHAAGAALHFIDRRAEGSIALTTVFARLNQETKFRAVHSRSDYHAYDGPGFVSVPQVDQLYGYCEAAR